MTPAEGVRGYKNRAISFLMRRAAIPKTHASIIVIKTIAFFNHAAHHGTPNRFGSNCANKLG